MGRSAGTGTPNWFRCAVERRESHHRTHLIQLTGRTRPNPSRSRNTRVADIEREYTCSCGHRGWTRLLDVVRRARRDASTLDRIERGSG